MGRLLFLPAAFREGILTLEEYDRDWKGKYVDPKLGTDSFMGYLQAVMAGVVIFQTETQSMIHDREKLESRFGVEIN